MIKLILSCLTSKLGLVKKAQTARKNNQSTLPIQCATIKPDSYISFEGHTYSRFAYEGKNIVFLIPDNFSDNQLLLDKMKNIVDTFDKAWDFYYKSTNKTPAEATNTTRNGKGTIAVVDSTCGYGCGYLGTKGIELLPIAWTNLKDNVFKNNLYDSALFYELGRNFWFYRSKVAYQSPDDVGTIETGFAVFMRFMSMEYAKVSPWTFNGTEFNTFKNEVRGLIKTYLKDSSYTWQTTLKIGRGVPNNLGLGSTDLFASFLFDLTDRFGNDFVTNIWKNIEKQPDAKNTQEALDNFIIASSLTAKNNLCNLFNFYKWPVSDSAKKTINQKMLINK